MQLSLFDLLVLVLCEGNLYLVIYALLRNECDSDNWQETSKHRGTQLIPGTVTQNLRLLLFFAWRHRWMRFYPGNPVGPGVKFAGVLLSVASIFIGFLQQDFPRWLVSSWRYYGLVMAAGFSRLVSGLICKPSSSISRSTSPFH